MERNRRKTRNTWGKLWGFLGALWLVLACVAGCGVSGDNGGSPAVGDRTLQITGETEIGSGGSGNADLSDRTAENGETESAASSDSEAETQAAESIEESGSYTSKDEVALYLHLYGHLPDNYLTKQEAQDLGWDSKKGNLWEVAPGMSIGGSRFGNYEKALPDKKGRKYFECDIDYEGGYRGAKRLIYSNDGLVFYTEDHYNTFEQLYGQ